MNAPTSSDQLGIEGLPPAQAPGAPHLVCRINAAAVKMVFPFVAKDDIRFYLNGINVRPLEDGSVMVVATDGHRYIVVRDPNGFAEKEIITAVSKDALKHANNAKHSLDVMSDGRAMISDQVAQPLFIQPGNSIIEANYPRIERVASVTGYKEGISGSVYPRYLNDALTIGKGFGDSIRFFTRDEDSPLLFLISGIGELECFGGIMKRRDNFDALPAWFPLPGEVETLSDV